MLKVHTTKFGNVALLCVMGKIIRGEAEALRSAVLAQVDTSVVVLDLVHVNMIDAGGLGMLLELREQTESRGIEFRLNNVTQLVRRILEITKLDTVFDITMESEAWSPLSHTEFAPHRGLAACACQVRDIRVVRSFG